MCVNPAHLFLGTQDDNRKDCKAKGRIRGNETRGEDRHGAKLKTQEVLLIRALNSQGYSYSKLAALFGVSDHTIGNIVKKRKWTHI
jgi:DNA invertase Pin-like site-specific DNA recombinase